MGSEPLGFQIPSHARQMLLWLYEACPGGWQVLQQPGGRCSPSASFAHRASPHTHPPPWEGRRAPCFHHHAHRGAVSSSFRFSPFLWGWICKPCAELLWFLSPSVPLAFSTSPLTFPTPVTFPAGGRRSFTVSARSVSPKYLPPSGRAHLQKAGCEVDEQWWVFPNKLEAESATQLIRTSQRYQAAPFKAE